MEPHLKTALNERNHKLDSLFSVKTQLMNLKKDKVTKEERNMEKTGGEFVRNMPVRQGLWRQVQQGLLRQVWGS